MAEALNCLQPSRVGDFEHDACGTCSSCLRIARHLHADVLIIEPGDSGTIKVEQVRDAIDRTSFRPFEGRKRVVIVNEADARLPANADLEGELRQLAGAFDDRRSRRAFAAVDEALAALKHNASPKIVADWLVLQL